MLKLFATLVLVLLHGLQINSRVTKQGWNDKKENVRQPIRENFQIESVTYFKPINSYPHQYDPLYDIPDDLDWRNKGVVTPVRSGVASEVFNIVDMIESDLAVKTGELESLSVQQIFDCCSGCNKSGINSIYATLEYIKKFGLESEKDYPFHRENNSKCNYNPNLVVQGTKGVKFEMVKQGNENDLKIICAMTGPVFVLVHVLGSFESYKSGVYYDSDCDPNTLNHSMLLVGYGTEGGKDYWIVKNSWGSNWGEEGYVKMSRNRNDNCGIAKFAFVAKISVAS